MMMTTAAADISATPAVAAECLSLLLARMKLAHLATQLDAVWEDASRRDPGHPAFLTQALISEWQGQQPHGIEAWLKQARFSWIKTLG